MTYIFPLDNLPETKSALAGGKATSLARMMKEKKVAVPFGYVITADAFEDGKLLSSAEKELRALIGTLPSTHTYAVRSSALNEDGGERSFAGQYETVTDVPSSRIEEAVGQVAASTGNDRVTEYSRAASEEGARSGIAVVIQQFVKPEFAGVIFTSDIISGKEDHLIGNYVHGEGEQLVSGQASGESFRINVMKYAYDGPSEMKPYAKKLMKYCTAIRKSYKIPMDIEWAVSKKKVYILQARPITTLRRLDMDTYRVNGTLSGYKMLTRTNVGEIFLKPVSPMTFFVLEKINEMLGIPDWLDNIYGQPYMNISVMCSILVSFGKSPEKALDAIRDLVGNIPEGAEVPIAPFYKKEFFRNLRKLLFPKNRSKLSKKEKHELIESMPGLAKHLTEEIHSIRSNEELLRYWENVMIPKLNDGLAAFLGEGGMAMFPLFSTRKKISKIAGEDMANRLCGGCVGVIDCMKPLLLIEDVLSGEISKEEYMDTCGHRCADEMELMAPRPYEDPDFLEKQMEAHRNSGADLHAMQKSQQDAFETALAEFKEKYPSRKKWIDKKIQKYAHANSFREYLRSLGVRLFCVFREYLLAAGRLNGLGDDVFMMIFPEVQDMLRGGPIPKEKILHRKESLRHYNAFPPFPSLIIGRFDPESWISDPSRRSDYFWDEKAGTDVSGKSDVKGFPGAAGVITGTARVILDLDKIDEISDGDILVTVATNIGWTLVFPRVSAIVTDIGAPLSHAAIVAREFGIPAVVGCGNATTMIKSGDRITVDGARGIVSINS